MNKSLIALLQLSCLMAGIFCLVGWLGDKAPVGQEDLFLVFARYLCPVIIVGLFLIIKRLNRKKPDLAPDYLKRHFGKYFEREGLCVVPAMAVKEGVAYVCLYYQNRHQGSCGADFRMEVNAGLFSKFKRLKSVKLEFSVGGGEFGVLRIPYAIPRKIWRKKAEWQLFMNVKYPQGQGEMLRFTDGMNMGSTLSKYTGLISLLGLFAGVLYVRSAAKISFVMPADVAEELPGELGFSQETIDGTSAPMNAFEVISTVRKAEPVEETSEKAEGKD